MGNKLSKAINIEAHSASQSVLKEFKRIGAEIKLVKFSKNIFKKKTPTTSDIKPKVVQKLI